jgi:hypothetical protein
MAKRVTNATVQVEQRDTTNLLRVTNAALQIEQRDTTNYLRVTNAVVMVEYALGEAPPVTKRYGPRVQWF